MGRDGCSRGFFQGGFPGGFSPSPRGSQSWGAPDYLIWDGFSMGFCSFGVSSHPPRSARVLGLFGQGLGVDLDPLRENTKTNSSSWWVQLGMHQNGNFLIKNSSSLPALWSWLGAGVTRAGLCPGPSQLCSGSPTRQKLSLSFGQEGPGLVPGLLPDGEFLN